MAAAGGKETDDENIQVFVRLRYVLVCTVCVYVIIINAKPDKNTLQGRNIQYIEQWHQVIEAGQRGLMPNVQDSIPHNLS